jgi:putative transcriptional regulator
MDFGKQLASARKKSGMSAETLAGTCGISRSYITLIENGKRRPSPKILAKIAEGLSLETEVVLHWYVETMRSAVLEKIDE